MRLNGTGTCYLAEIRRKTFRASISAPLYHRGTAKPISLPDVNSTPLVFPAESIGASTFSPKWSIHDLAHYLNIHCHKEFSPEELAARCGPNPAYLSSVSHEEMGTPASTDISSGLPE